MTYAEGPRFPGFPRPYPQIPPEVPPGPERPFVHPPVPTVWMPGGGDELRSQVYEQLLARRTVFLERTLDAETASFVAAQLMTLDADAAPAGGPDAETDADAGPDGGSDAGLRPVTLVVNSSGGPLDAVSAVLDTIDLMRCPVDTTCIGQAVGTAAVVVAAGTGRRRAGGGAHFRLRLPELELTGSASRLHDEVAHQRHLHDVLVDRLATATGQERRLVARDINRGRAFPAEEAVTYGLIDELIPPRH